MANSDEKWEILDMSPGIRLVRLRISKLPHDEYRELWSQLDVRNSNEGVIVFNLEHLDWFCSDTIGGLASAAYRLRKRKDSGIVLCHLSPFVIEIFEITRFPFAWRIGFNVVETEREAIARAHAIRDGE